MTGDWYSPAQLAMPVASPMVGFYHVCVGYPDGDCHCFHPWAYFNERPVPDHICPPPTGGIFSMTTETDPPIDPEPPDPITEPDDTPSDPITEDDASTQPTETP